MIFIPGHGLRAVFLFMLLLFAAGCSTEIYSPAAHNPPPGEPFRNFGQFRLQPVTLNPAYAEHGYNLDARKVIERSMQEKLGPVLQGWDKGKGRTLVVSPDIEEIKFIGGAARFWAGAMPGASAVVMRVTFTDAATDKVIASPVFYQHANAMGGAWTFGGTDNGMLYRIVTLVVAYSQANYETAVGGPTGAPEDRVKTTN